MPWCSNLSNGSPRYTFADVNFKKLRRARVAFFIPVLIIEPTEYVILFKYLISYLYRNVSNNLEKIGKTETNL